MANDILWAAILDAQRSVLYFDHGVMLVQRTFPEVDPLPLPSYSTNYLDMNLGVTRDCVHGDEVGEWG